MKDAVAKETASFLLILAGVGTAGVSGGLVIARLVTGNGDSEITSKDLSA